MAMKWIMLTGLGVFTILIIMILFIGTVGHTIHIMDMDIHHGTILSITHPGDGVGTAGIHHIADGDGAFHPITVTTIHITEGTMVGEIRTTIIIMVMVDIMEATITTQTDMSIQGITVMEEEQPGRMHIAVPMNREEVVQVL